MLHIPILRKGQPYRSVDVAQAVHHRTREVIAEVSIANTGLIRRDMLDQQSARNALAEFTTTELLGICSRASDCFANDALPIGDDQQTPEDYIAQVSATTGVPHNMARRNMEKIRNIYAEMRTVLDGLTRHVDLKTLDDGFGESEGHAISFYPRGLSLGVVLPNNSPGVHALWAPATVMKTPLILKPGSAEPWTPLRMIQAMIRAGAPPGAFSFYPSDHAGGAEILRQCGRGMMFGDASSVGAWRNDSRIEIHGPGYSKILIGEDCIDGWEQYVDVITASILENGGRSCINASGVWVPRHADRIAEAVADRLARVQPRAAGDPEAQIAPFVDASVAQRTNSMIDAALGAGGARDVTAQFRGTGRLAEWEGCSYLLPTIIRCEAEHGLANREFLFPFAAVVEAPQPEVVRAIGQTLVVTAITGDERLINRLVTAPNVDRLNIGPIPTFRIGWDQPHEGNLFDHLYGRRAFQRAGAA